MQKVITKKGTEEGVTSMILAGIHGNEICGIEAFQEILSEIKIDRGIVHFMYGNPKAIESKQRFTEENLNRMFQEKSGLSAEQLESYEFKRSREIMPYLDQADILLDLHASNTPDSIPFAICESQAYSIVKFLPIKLVVSGIDKLEPGGTDVYMNENGKIGICLECGYAKDKNSVFVAKEAIINFLIATGHKKGEQEELSQTHYKMEKIYHTKSNLFRLKKPFGDFEELKKDQEIGLDGVEKVIASDNGVILFARNREVSGSEAFLFGKKTINYMKYEEIFFLKGETRLGLLNPPFGSLEINSGVEQAPEAILKGDYSRKVTEEKFTFSLPEDLRPEKYFFHMASESQKCAELITKKKNKKSLLCTIGGDHSIGFSSLLSVLKETDGKVGVISFDSHADLHCVRTSKSGNFHGMWLRPFMEKFDEENIAKAVLDYKNRVNILYVGNIKPGPGELEIINKFNLEIISSEESQKSKSLDIIDNFIKSVDHLHISFDIDVFTESLAPATGTPNPNGYKEAQIFPILDRVTKKNKTYSIDLVEVNPLKEGCDETVALAKKVLNTMISNIVA